MAYELESELEKQKKQEELKGQVKTSGLSSNITAGPVVAGSKGAKGPTSSGRFTNLQSYLDLNKSQAEGLSSNIADNIQSGAEQNKADLSAIENRVKADVDKNTVKADANFVDSAISDPTEFVKNQENVSAFHTLRDADYKGPTNINQAVGYSDTLNKIDKSKQLAQNTQNEGGRFQILGEMFSKPTYNQGQKNLDQLLIQNDSTSRQKFADTVSKVNELPSYLQDTQNRVGSYVNQGLADTQAARELVNKKLFEEGTGALPSFEQSVLSKLTAEQTRRDAERASLLSGLNSDKLSTDLLSRLGLNTGANLYNVNLKDAKYQTAALGPTKEGIASLDDYAKYSALSQLAGNTPNFLNSAFQDRAGKDLNVSPIDFNKAALSNDLKAQDAAYKSEMYPIETELAQLVAADLPRTSEEMLARLNRSQELATLRDLINEKYQINRKVSAL